MRPNDILLPNSDLAISRTHCRIIYEYGFKDCKKTISKTWLEFFKIFHDKYAKKGRRYLPKEIRIIIMQYLKEPNYFYI